MFNQQISVFDVIDLTGYDNAKANGAISVTVDKVDETKDSIVLVSTTYDALTGERKSDRTLPLKVSDLKAERDAIQKKIDGWNEQIKAIDSLVKDVESAIDAEKISG